jgi:hypothetical protein
MHEKIPKKKHHFLLFKEGKIYKYNNRRWPFVSKILGIFLIKFWNKYNRIWP